MDRIKKHMPDNRQTVSEYGDDIVEANAGRCTEMDSGARNVDHKMTNTLLPDMSKEILRAWRKGSRLSI